MKSKKKQTKNKNQILKLVLFGIGLLAIAGYLSFRFVQETRADQSRNGPFYCNSSKCFLHRRSNTQLQGRRYKTSKRCKGINRKAADVYWGRNIWKCAGN